MSKTVRVTGRMLNDLSVAAERIGKSPDEVFYLLVMSFASMGLTSGHTPEELHEILEEAISHTQVGLEKGEIFPVGNQKPN